MSPQTELSPLPRPLSDTELVAAIAVSDESALASLYDRHAPLVLGLAYRILGSRDDAEEIVQETFTLVWRNAASYEPSRASVTTWLALLARSRAIDRLRSRRVVERTSTSMGSLGGEADHTSSEGFSSVLTEERRQRVERELAELPVDQRQVLEMAFFAGLTQTEIAAATGIPLGTVKTRTLLAMKKLRAALRHEIRELL
jgi:RNA polymerase sigma-70 factor, ECF subfamily